MIFKDFRFFLLKTKEKELSFKIKKETRTLCKFLLLGWNNVNFDEDENEI